MGTVDVKISHSKGDSGYGAPVLPPFRRLCLGPTFRLGRLEYVAVGAGAVVQGHERIKAYLQHGDLRSPFRPVPVCRHDCGVEQLPAASPLSLPRQRYQ